MLTRPAHASEDYEPPSGGKAVRAYTHYYPLPKDEQWWVSMEGGGGSIGKRGWGGALLGGTIHARDDLAETT